MLTQITINSQNVRVAMPIKWNALLDERLDECRLSVRQVTTELYPIGAQVKITVGYTDKDFIISADESVEVPPGSGKYDHELSLIEPTKLLEGIVVESLTFANSLGHMYGNSEASPAYASSQIKNDLLPLANNWLRRTSPARTLYVPELGNLIKFKNYTGQYKIQIYALVYRYDETEYDKQLSVINNEYQDPYYIEPIPIKITEPGIYRIHIQWSSSDATYRFSNSYIDYYFQCADNLTPLPKWNICSVINRALNLAEPHLQSVSPRFMLDPAQAAEFEKILAPEFAFTKCTLKEILDQIGGFIHGIPRLIRGESGELDTIHYDMLNGTEEALISSQNIHYISETHSQNIEDYVTELDSTVDNLVNTLNSGEGAVTEPYAGGFKSVRSEEAYARIEEGNMVISTSLPIYSVQKLEVIDTKNQVGDITAYVFEGAEYGRLSSFDGKYPTSKAYALYYNLGEKNIKGLGFKSPTVLGGAGAKYSIANIIKAATGDDSITSDWWSGDDDTAGNYPKLAFRITYTPIFSARILQHKPYVEPGALKLAMVYNQGANLVETRYYGENMRGAVARMGNPEFTRSYRMPNLTYIPKIGEIFKRRGDEYYISSVTVAVYSTCVEFTVGMSKDFNRLSQYIGINSEWRAYEVSERKAYNRDIIYRDFCIIGDSVDNDGMALARESAMYYIANAFSHTALFSEPLTVAQVTTYDNSNKPYPMTLPVVSTAFGNAMVFSFGMADNYSAGSKSVYDGNGDIIGYWQTDVPYVDYYGRAKSMKFELGPSGTALNFGDAATFTLPQGDEYVGYGAIGTPDNNQLEIDKNGTEILHINYQLEFVSNWNDLIIGSALARNCLMVSKRETNKNGDAVHAAAVYVVNKKVGRFDSEIDLTSAMLIQDYRNNMPIVADSIMLGDIQSTAVGVAWAIADQSTGEILLAQNMEISVGDVIHLPKISLRHKLS
ncbi:MAG: hypothetical protein K2K13_05820 [Clostridiales bacterium]|nr:hypothetical protein [Clostridiales bacterium]